MRKVRKAVLKARAVQFGAAAALLASAGCGTPRLTEAGLISRYDRLQASETTASKSRLFVDRAALAGARTVRIIPTAFSEVVSGPGLTPVERRVIANAADRALCYELSLRYDVVSSGPADLTVRSAVTRVGLSNVPAQGATIGASAAISIAAQVGVGFADTVGKVPVPRLPIGLGDLTVEAEALDARRQQRAAIVWAGAANSFTNQARFSVASDAYDLAGDFGQDFGYLLATGEDPFQAELTIPTYDRVRVTVLGEMPRDPDCQAFGRAPGIDGIIGDSLGLPPDWTDKGPPAGRP
ncbi:DUF3313 domain-containing protein [Methylobacterium isbiliense]|jgi:hypothetical protein|uniref:DUF3313 domain-containing protein n=1 Tax=Methylobacterium isbiliense TaxID=315478 RepID=A0ABQ4S8Q7_9HYPH|nr:DUF3313 domain-containing protein [Methylobacterium isbiliense]MDN3626919.1 DUF3313 domain-containing protein [Methylobacterium isbiliense]GJD99361.1 hypothetical protein GMJLKIPL_1277 [Methylobacterium isbiliense]